MYPEEITSQEIYDRTIDIFRRYFRFRDGHRLTGVFDAIRKKILRPFSHRGPVRMVRTDDLTMTQAAAAYGIIHAGNGRLNLDRKTDNMADQKYIRGCFGIPMFSEDESQRIDKALCSGIHRDCRVYLTDGVRIDNSETDKEDAMVRKFLSDAAIQRQKNESYYRNHMDICRNGINRLSQQIRNAMLVYPQPLNIPSQSGRLFPERNLESTEAE